MTVIEDDEGRREEEASNLVNAIVDNAQTLVEEYGWSREDVLDALDRALRD